MVIIVFIKKTQCLTWLHVNQKWLILWVTIHNSQGNTHSKHAVLQSQVGRIETQKVGVVARNSLHSDPTHGCQKAGSLQVGSLYTVPVRKNTRHWRSIRQCKQVLGRKTVILMVKCTMTVTKWYKLLYYLLISIARMYLLHSIQSEILSIRVLSFQIRH